ncbi:hypothetical protein NC651_029444 [Populus alba x Populus x berolinensis]|nr:hypothetical protein NC651_029444 [Populus alba x Populus x berolinensis]
MGGFVDGLVREKKEKENEIGVLKSEVKELTMSVEAERDRLSRICLERDLLKSDVDNWMKEADEKRERESEEEIEKLKKEYDLLVKEKKDREKEIAELKRLRGSAENNLMERVEEIEYLKREIEGIVRERNEIGVEKSEQKLKIIELEREAGELNEIEEGILRKKVMKLEETLGRRWRKKNAMAREIDGLMEEKKEKERTIMRLMEEK